MKSDATTADQQGGPSGRQRCVFGVVQMHRWRQRCGIQVSTLDRTRNQ